MRTPSAQNRRKGLSLQIVLSADCSKHQTQNAQGKIPEIIENNNPVAQKQMKRWGERAIRWAFGSSACESQLERGGWVSVIRDTWNPKFRLDLLLKVHLYLKHETCGTWVACGWPMSFMLPSCKWHQTAESQLLLDAAGLFGLMGRLVTDFLPLAVWTRRTRVRKMPYLTHPYGPSRDNLHPAGGTTSAITVISFIDLIFSFWRARKDSPSGSSVRKYLGFFFSSVTPPPAHICL